MQNVQRVIYERDHRLVQEYWEKGKSDMEELKLYEQTRDWFEGKWKEKFIPDNLRKGRNL